MSSSRLPESSSARHSFFALPPHLSRKEDARLISADQEHFTAVEDALAHQVDELQQKLDRLRGTGTRTGEAALERDLSVHRLSAQLRMLERHGVDLCLGRMVGADGATVYVGRAGLSGPDGTRLLIDWRAPAAAPFFSATLAQPHGLTSRRRYRWQGGQVVDYWDETFPVAPDAAPVAPETTAALASDATSAALALDDQSSFIESLGAARSSQMRDVLSTIQADQDAIIRASAHGPLVVDGGPGTGKTVVALHRAAHLLYSQPQLARGGGVLVVGPHRPYLDYVADVLPSLGEEGVRLCTLADMVPEGEAASGESLPADSEAADRLKSQADPVAVAEAAVSFYEEPPGSPVAAETPWGDVDVDAQVWREAFDAAEPGASHNDAQTQVWTGLVEAIHTRLAAQSTGSAQDWDRWDGTAEDDWGDEPADGWGQELSDPVEALDVEQIPEVDQLRAELMQDESLQAALSTAWPLLRYEDLVADLWAVPAFTRLCFPRLSEEEVAALLRDRPRAWTAGDLPFLDAVRRRVGDPETAQRESRRAAAREAEAQARAQVTADLIAADDSDLQVMSMLRGADLSTALVDGAEESSEESGQTSSIALAERLDGPFAHIIVDEAQELTDAQWQMVVSRCPSRSVTVVGDRVQARTEFASSWEERLARVGLERARVAHLNVNYRTPTEIMDVAEPAIRAVLPDANVPRAVRSSGAPVVRAQAADLEPLLRAWLAAEDEGVACLVDPAAEANEGWQELAARMGPRVRVLTPSSAKGLEFDFVALLDPDSWDTESTRVAAAVDRYVAMTRSTHHLVLVAQP